MTGGQEIKVRFTTLTEQALKPGIEYVATSPEEFSSFVKNEGGWAQMVHTLGLKQE
jgi:hypothetical protein